jgi:hypothetical protein
VPAWLAIRGTRERPLPVAWTVEPRIFDGFAAGTAGRPQLAVGDEIAYYAAIRQVVFAVGRVTRGAEREDWLQEGWKDGTAERWPWVIGVQLDAWVPDLGMAPKAASVGIDPSSVRRKSHIRLTDEQFRAADDAVRNARLVRLAGAS